MSLTLPISYSYEPTNREVIEAIDGGAVLWNTVQRLAENYAQSLDPNGDYPDLAQQLAEAMRDDPEFYNKVLGLYEVNSENNSDPSDPPPANDNSNEEQGIIDWINSWVGEEAAGIFGDVVPDYLDEIIKNVTDDFANVTKIGGGISIYGDAMESLAALNKAANLDFDPKVMFSLYVDLFAGGGLVELSPSGKILSPLLKKILATIGVAVTGDSIGTRLASYLEEAAREGRDLYDAAREFIEEQLKTVPETIKVLEELWGAVEQAASDAADGILQKINDAMAAGKSFVEAVAEVMQEVRNGIMDSLNDALNAAVAAGQMAAEVAANIVESIGNTLKGLVDGAVQSAVDAYNAVVTAGGDLAAAIADISASLAEGLNQLMDDAAQAFEDFGNTLFDYAAMTAQAIDAALDALNQFLDDAAQAIGDAVEAAGEWLGDAWNGWWAAWNNLTPLTLDLDGDGIELVSLANSQTYWDIDEDGFAERSGWVGAGDGLLAIDLNSDGIINDHSELFGTMNTDGFSVLAQYDINSDGVIDINDTQFGDLLVWQDINQNGLSEAAELYSLADLDIVSIDLNASTPANLYIEGHNVSHVSSYTVDDGVNAPQVLDIVDVWFQYDDVNTNFVGDYTLDLNSLFVTTMRGYGNLPDLHISASIDNDTSNPNSLMSLLQGFRTLDFAGIFVDDSAVMDQVRDIMFRWAGVDTVDSTSRGSFVDARELEFLETLLAKDFLQGGGNPNPGAGSSAEIDRTFEFVLYNIAGKLIGQAAGAELFNDAVFYNPATDAFVGFTAFNQDALDALLAKSLDATQVGDKATFWANVVNMVDVSVGIDTLPAAALSALETAVQASDNSLNVALLQDKIANDLDDLLYWTPAGETVLGTSGDDVYQGGAGDDYYSGKYGDDVLSGGIGNDRFYGGGDNDTLIGQLGDDELRGENGNDNYVFNLGHGNDTIIEKNGTDTITLGENITAADLILTRIGSYSLKLSFAQGEGAGSITIDNHFSNGVIEFVQFNDGTSLDMNSMGHTLHGTAGDDLLKGHKVGYGGNGVDTIYGGDGNDTIYGTGVTGYSYTAENYLYGDGGNDTIYGDRSTDTIHGGDGDDTLKGYYGDDVIYGDAGADQLWGQHGADTFVFEAATAYSDVDTINDFKLSQNDIVDVSDLLSGYDPLTDAITDFVEITTSGSNSILSVDADGGADNFVQIATLINASGLTDEEALETSGNLIAA